MQATTSEPYSDTPSSTRSASSRRDASPRSSSSDATIKPLPPLPHTPTYSDEEPYRDDPPTPSGRIHSSPPRYNDYQQQPYHDDPSPPRTPDTDNVPLTHLLVHTQSHSIQASYPHDLSYPNEAPPSYAIAVRQSYRDTLIHYLPRDQDASRSVDEESGVELVRADDIRHTVENMVAIFVVAGLLLVVAGVLAWLALGSGVFE